MHILSNTASKRTLKAPSKFRSFFSCRGHPYRILIRQGPVTIILRKKPPKSTLAKRSSGFRHHRYGPLPIIFLTWLLLRLTLSSNC